MHTVPTTEYMMEKNSLKALKMLWFNLVLGLKIFKQFSFCVPFFHLQILRKGYKVSYEQSKTTTVHRYTYSDTYISKVTLLHYVIKRKDHNREGLMLDCKQKVSIVNSPLHSSIKQHNCV